MEIYGNRLKQLRKEHEITQKQLADVLSVTQTAVNYWEGGKREPTMEIQKKIADYFGVSIDYMMRTDEELSANISGNEWKSNLMNKFNKVV